MHGGGHHPAKLAVQTQLSYADLAARDVAKIWIRD